MNTQIKTGHITVSYPKIARCIKTLVKIINPYSNESVEVEGIWDTGATGSAITKSVAKNLKLIPIGKMIVCGIHGAKEVNSYPIKIEPLGKADVDIAVMATECDELSADSSVGVLIGMDIISKGDFAVSNFNNSTIMSFRIPSLQTIDFGTSE